jgi:hypothetical protein
MNEMVYVLAVQALVFGAISTVLVAQRANVFEWPADRTWPVTSTSFQFVLLYAHVLLLLCCFIAAGRFASFVPVISDSCARSAGRLSTATALAAVYVGVQLAVQTPRPTDCVLCQLLGTSCAKEEKLFWSLSYTAYACVLLPAVALHAGLLVTAAAMCHDGAVAPRRLATANCAWLLLAQTCSTLEHNKQLLPSRCRSSQHIAPDVQHWTIVLACALGACDCTAAVFASKVATGHKSRFAPIAFTAMHLLSLSLPGLLTLEELPIQWTVLLVHTVAGAVLVVLDLADVWLRYFANHKLEDDEEPAEEPMVSGTLGYAGQAEPLTGGMTGGMTAGRNAAFEVEPARRRRFLLAYNDKSRWPAAPHVSKKKI